MSMKTEMGRKSEAARRAFMEQMTQLWPLAKGSISQVRKPCTRKGCRACAQGHGHAAYIYTYREGKKLKCLHVRPEHAELVRTAVENARRLEALLVQMGHDLVKRTREDA